MDPQEPVQHSDTELLKVQTIRCQMEGVSKLVTLDGELILFEGRYEIRSQEKVIGIYYNSTASVGIQENNLVCFMQESQQEEDEDGKDQLLKMIDQQPNGQFCLQRGNITIRIQFKVSALGDLKEAYEKMSQKIGQDDEGASAYDEDQEMGEMISADDIDEDGNIIDKESPPQEP